MFKTITKQNPNYKNALCDYFLLFLAIIHNSELSTNIGVRVSIERKAAESVIGNF